MITSEQVKVGVMNDFNSNFATQSVIRHSSTAIPKSKVKLPVFGSA